MALGGSWLSGRIVVQASSLQLRCRLEACTTMALLLALCRLYWHLMLKKRKTRELAMQVLFVWDTNGASDVDLARQVVTDGTPDVDVRSQALAWATAAWEQREICDTRTE